MQRAKVGNQALSKDDQKCDTYFLLSKVIFKTKMTTKASWMIGRLKVMLA
jgi:hypothetical protein